MGFLNNSGDILLDAVLTDVGRQRLARGDGSFRIVKFALADDEIDYGLFDPTQQTTAQALSILQTPVLEAMTNAYSSMKSKLLTINLKNLLYLPVIKINNKAADSLPFDNTFTNNQGFSVSSDVNTENYVATATFSSKTLTGNLKGFNVANSGLIRLDQGLDNSAILTIQPELVETQYFVEIDNRFGSLTDASHNILEPLFVDEDNIATYLLTLQGNPDSVMQNMSDRTNTTIGQDGQVIAGGRGTILKFGIASSQDLQSSVYLFDTYGFVDTTTRDPSSGTLKKLATSVTVYGGTTGYTVEMPVVFLKYV
jgi:hypothetical protein